ALRGGRGLKLSPGRLPVTRLSVVAPALRGGRGLKHIGGRCQRSRVRVAPALRGGRGLKPPLDRPQSQVGYRGSRPSGRERIETFSRRAAACFRRSWLPPFGAGEDLNIFTHFPVRLCLRVAPALRGGRGLKRTGIDWTQHPPPTCG